VSASEIDFMVVWQAILFEIVAGLVVGEVVAARVREQASAACEVACGVGRSVCTDERDREEVVPFVVEGG
jgi:hypothetical protein